ncbi:MAG: S1C family serine protease [Patescibacteria group bacterium]
MLAKDQSNNKGFDHEIREIYQERNAKMLISKPKKNSDGLLISHILWLVVAIVASMTTTLVVISWYNPIKSSTPENRLKPVLVTSESSINEVVNKLSSASVVIFAKQSVAAKNPTWQQTYLISKALGHGVVLSSDGWLVSTNEVVSDLTKKYVVAVADGAMYEAEVLIKDPATPFVYLKISAANLTPAAFSRSDDINLGDSVIVLATATQSLERSVLINKITAHDSVGTIKNAASLVKNSNIVSDVYNLSTQLPSNFIGAPVVTLAGKIIGLIISRDGAAKYLSPLETLDIVIDGLFSSQQINRPALGVNYVTLGAVTAYSSANLNLPKDGALLVSNGNLLAVEAKSSAAASGLKEGDVITYVAGERVNGTRSLSYLLQQYKPGTRLVLKIWRDGKEREVEVKLGEIVSQAPAASVEVKK